MGEMLNVMGAVATVSVETSAEKVIGEGAMDPLQVIVPLNDAVSVTVPVDAGLKKSAQLLTLTPVMTACAAKVKLAGMGTPPTHGFPVALSVTFSMLAVGVDEIAGANFSLPPPSGLHFVMPAPITLGPITEADADVDTTAGNPTKVMKRTPALATARRNTAFPLSKTAAVQHSLA